MAVSHKLCKSSQLDQFITSVPADQVNTTSILTSTIAMTGNATEMALYKVDKTGYYCVALVPVGNNSTFEAWVNWSHSYGELPAGDYPKLLVSYFIRNIIIHDLLIVCVCFNSCMVPLLVFI